MESTMSDGTTGIQVAPIPTESEMASIRQIFTNVANALVRASELAKQVDELEAKFKTLNDDYTRVMARSDQLEQSLSETRAQRDEANAKLHETSNNLAAEQGKTSDLSYKLEAAQDHISQLETQLAQSKLDSAAWFKAATEADDRATKAESLLAEIKSKLGIVDPPKPVVEAYVAPQPEPTPSAQAAPEQPKAEPMPEGVRPITEAEVNSPQAQTDPAVEVDFNKPYHWDAALNRWVND